MKGIIYENALKFKAEVFKLIGIALCTPAPAIVLKGFIDSKLLKHILTVEMFVALIAMFIGEKVLNLAYKILIYLDEVQCDYDH